MTKQTISDIVGLGRLFNDGEVLADVRGHAKRIADDIAQTAQEVGGDPLLSRRFRACVTIMEALNRLSSLQELEASGRIILLLGDLKRAADPLISRLPETPLEAILTDIAEERHRQVRKGYDADHDDGHRDGQIAIEASNAIDPDLGHPNAADWIKCAADVQGPDRRRELIQGIALAVAEVERLDRIALKMEEPL